MSLRPIYYDTETTGVRSDKDRIIEIAAYDPIEDRSFVHLVNPNIPIPPEATAIHNITDAMVANAPTFKEVAALFLDFCPSNTVLIAHNNDSFDKLFLEAEFQRAGVDMRPFPYIDTLKWSRKYRSDLPRHTLQALREVYGFPANNAHRALDDVIVLHQVFSVMIDDLSMETVIELLGKSNKSQNLDRMPFGKHQGKPLSEIPKNYVSWLDSTGAFQKPENQELKQAFVKFGLLVS